MKKRTKKQKHTAAFKLLLTGLLALLILLVWVGSDKSLVSKLISTTAPDAVQPQQNIAQVIAPLLHEQTVTLTFEDELPDPISKTKKHPETSFYSPHEDRHQVALIIDDVGYSLNALRRLLALPFALTVSILPDAPYAAEAARMAHQHGIKVMLHMPMQTSNPKYQQKMEKYYLHQDMDKATFTDVFERALAKVPYVQGINNHMGSLLTSDKKTMLWLMELCAKHDLFFVDSRTSSTSVAATTAQESAIPWNKRDIFLDHSVEPEALQSAWDSMLFCVSRNDHCIVLAHPHPETLAFLEQHAQGLNMQSFVAITDLLKH